ncbi:MAG TPA: ATP-binding cassette domain-containing protein, partial [Cytophagaceae bacterium]
LTLDNTILDELKQMGSEKTETELRNILGCFLFSNDDVFKKIKVLSGGEKSRVALAKTLISQANFLLLDEPTNHLDIQSVNILIQALQQYQGTYVVISHDRHFISQVATKIWYIENHELKEYPGTYEEYKFWMEQKIKEEKNNSVAAPVKKKEKESPLSNSTINDIKEAERQLKQANSKLEKVEQKISELEKKKLALEEDLSKPSVYSNVELLAEHNARYEELLKELQQEQTAWDLLAEEIEKLENKI